MIYSLSLLTLAVGVAAKTPVNIVFIVSDDLGFNDVSFHGSQQVPTPHIDAIAEAGLKLMNYHVQPVCSPTRSTFMSGRHVIHTGIYSPFAQGTPLRLNLSYTLLPEYLKLCCGYSTHMVGKWHLGQNVMKAIPIGRGFDTYFGYWSGAEDYYLHNTKGAYDYNDNVAPASLRVAAEYNHVYSAFSFTERAVSIIGAVAAADTPQPLFLYLPYQNVHWPLEAPDDYVARFANTTGGNHARNMVCAMVAVLDSGVGNVTAALKAAGIHDNTFVIFSSDNGGPTNGNEGTQSNNFPLRGGKNTIWEGGTRVVGAIMGPGIPAGGITYEKMHATDWLPTLVSMAAGRSWTNFIPKDEPEYELGDGLDLWPWLSGQVNASPRDWLVYEAHPDADVDQSHGEALVVGDWKIIKTGQVNPQDENGNFLPPGQASGSQKWLLSCGQAVPRDGPAEDQKECSTAFCLFNVTADPCEYHNVAGAHPEVVASLRKRLEDFQATAVPPVKAEGCQPILINVTGVGAAWQPCDAPGIDKGTVVHYAGLDGSD